MKYNRTIDRMLGHDYPGVYGNGFVQWELDELELGARVAMAIDDPEQAWWEIIGFPMLRKMEYEEANDPRNNNDNGLDYFSPEHL